MFFKGLPLIGNRCSRTDCCGRLRLNSIDFHPQDRLQLNVNSVFNIAGSLLLLCLTLPFFIIIPVLIKLGDSGPVLYSGQRLGLHKKPYWMYKFRTLRIDAHQIVGAELLTQKQKLETPIGSFMRETRLDELPQLINVLKGEMNIIGPRPERPEIYERYCKDLEGYDLRFQVRPGVFGYAQIFTPHSAPKRLRSLIDAHFTLRQRSVTQDISLFGYSIMALVVKGLATTRLLLVSSGRRILGGSLSQERRRLRRTACADALVHLCAAAPDDREELPCRLIDLNEEAILVECEHALTEVHVRLRLTRLAPNAQNRPRKQRTVRCLGTILMMRPPLDDEQQLGYVIRIEPLTPLNAFKLQKYFLASSIS
ncbi:MAG: hypothetical protein C1943_14905 [Halochromatium sp.]|nr:hypothetical protein [Halochromatium sp.]